MSKEIKLLEKFCAGWTGKGDNVRTNYYTYDLDLCLHNAIEGAVIIDKSDCGENGVIYVCNGPMCDTSLPPQTINKFNAGQQTIDLLLGPGGLQGAFAYLLDCKKQKPDWSGLDFVSLDIHVGAWRTLGAKIGQLIDGRVVWER